MKYNNIESEKRAILFVADLMMAAARTAPKGCGLDNLETFILDGVDKDRLTTEMRKIAEETGADFFNRDADNVDQCPCILFIGIHHNPVGLENCMLCGFTNCGEMKKSGANCAFNITDLGIAVGSAVSVAANHRIDNRVMFSAGKAALKINCFSNDVKVCYGIPLSTTSKSIFFDRGMVSGALVTK